MSTLTPSATRLLHASNPPASRGVKLPRQIDQLSYAWLLDGRPTFIPKPTRLKGSKAAGLSYEKKAVREVKNRLSAVSWHYHQWIQFSDRQGNGYAEPELFCVLKDRVILFEMKLTGGVAGRMQLEGLYKPLLEFIFKKPVHCCIVCKWITNATPGPFVNGPEDFIQQGLKYGTWHWLP
jgi:hypothetical protein